MCGTFCLILHVVLQNMTTTLKKKSLFIENDIQH